MKSLKDRRIERDYQRTKIAFWVVLSLGLGVWAACVTHEFMAMWNYGKSSSLSELRK